jgi:hypothetical protein
MCNSDVNNHSLLRCKYAEVGNTYACYKENAALRCTWSWASMFLFSFWIEKPSMLMYARIDAESGD